jgi:Phosphotransferase enzyme family
VNLERSSILKIGSVEIDGRPFTERGFQLLPVKLRELRKAANKARAILITEPPGRIGIIRERLERLKPIADAYGLAFGVLTTEKEREVVQKIVASLGIAARSRVRSITDVANMAEFTRRDPGPPGGDVKIFSDRGIKANVRHLLKRSFHDCDRIYLESLSGGRAALNVFSVHAWLRKSIVGPRPLPFFFKVDGQKEIEQERTNYREYADFFIPFHLRPNVVPERCVEGDDVSSIVGNFVDESRLLREVLRTRQSPGVIFSLFENTLKGFRAQPSIDSFNVVDSNLADFVKDRAKASEVAPDVITLARELGMKTSPVEIEAMLVEKTNGVKRPFRAYHGDLHPGNVMARGRDAIVIDFSAVKRGPITADPATLEVGLVFGTDQQEKLKDFEEWRIFVDEIYGGVPIHKPPLPEPNPGPFSWLRRAVGETRHVLLGCDCEQCETAAVLTTFLLRFARLGVEISGTGLRNALALRKHSYALVVAERLALAMPACDRARK